MSRAYGPELENINRIRKYLLNLAILLTQESEKGMFIAYYFREKHLTLDDCQWLVWDQCNCDEDQERFKCGCGELLQYAKRDLEVN